MNDKKYVSAELVKAEFTGNFQESYTPGHIKALIDTVPAANVRENKTGKVIKTGRIYPYCSECDKNLDHTYYKFCPWCGAEFVNNQNDNTEKNCDEKSQMIFKLRYNLLKLKEYRKDDVFTDTFWVNINVLSDDFHKARAKAEEWLKTDGHKVYKYEDIVGFQPNGSECVIL